MPLDYGTDTNDSEQMLVSYTAINSDVHQSSLTRELIRDWPAFSDFGSRSSCNSYNVSWIPNHQSYNIDWVNLNIGRIEFF